MLLVSTMATPEPFEVHGEGSNSLLYDVMSPAFILNPECARPPSMM